MSNVSSLYASCMEQTSDAEYCADVIDVVAQVAASRVFSHIHKNTRFFLLLPDVIYISKSIGEVAVLFAVKASYAARVVFDQQKKGIAVLLEAPNHVVTLVYEREGGKPVLKKTMVTNRQLLGAVS